MKIVFMGTPDFAVPCLKALVENNHNVEAVFTREDKPVGRKQILTPPPVKVTAEEYGIKVLQPKKLKDNSEIFEILKAISPDVIVVVAYGRILPEEILNLPKYGCVNVHGSILPKLRGASPIQWSVVSGETKTGVTTMLMDTGIDTGDILEIKETEILPFDTAETLYDRISKYGAELLLSTLSKLEEGDIIPQKQDESKATYAPILTKDMGKLNFFENAFRLDCLIRGFTPWPLTYFFFEGRRFKVLKAEPIENFGIDEVGVCFEKNGEFYISCAENTALKLLAVCPDGSKKMDAASFINGRFIPLGSKLN